MSEKIVTLEQLLESARQSEALAMQVAQAAQTALGDKQETLTGTTGQVVGFDAQGRAVPQAAPEGGMISFNGRKGAVTPQSGDYTAEQVGAKASGWVPFAAGTSAPSDKTQLWIDTTANTGGMKYWNGSAWVAVPAVYT